MIPLSGMLLIPQRFNGPSDSGNGGFTCGLVSMLFEGNAEVTLRSPPPLETPLDVAHTPEGIEVLDGSRLVATATAMTDLFPAVPPAPSWDEAVEASRSYMGFDRHEFPTCFTCGPDRQDGLGIFPGPMAAGVAAAPWSPGFDLPHTDGVLTRPIVWAALDCAGAWAEARDLTIDPVVLGRMAALIDQPIEAGRAYVVIGWVLGSEGRKTYAGTALIDETGLAVAVAKQTWISVRA